MTNIATMPTTPKPQTFKGVIAANVQLLIEQLEAGHSEGLTYYLTAIGRFHKPYRVRKPVNCFGRSDLHRVFEG